MGGRLIFHVDVNSAFLSWEAVDRLSKGDSLDLRTELLFLIESSTTLNPK